MTPITKQLNSTRFFRKPAKPHAKQNTAASSPALDKSLSTNINRSQKDSLMKAISKSKEFAAYLKNPTAKNREKIVTAIAGPQVGKGMHMLLLFLVLMLATKSTMHSSGSNEVHADDAINEARVAWAQELDSGISSDITFGGPGDGDKDTDKKKTDTKRLESKTPEGGVVSKPKAAVAAKPKDTEKGAQTARDKMIEQPLKEAAASEGTSPKQSLTLEILLQKATQLAKLEGMLEAELAKVEQLKVSSTAAANKARLASLQKTLEDLGSSSEATRKAALTRAQSQTRWGAYDVNDFKGNPQDWKDLADYYQGTKLPRLIGAVREKVAGDTQTLREAQGDANHTQGRIDKIKSGKAFSQLEIFQYLEGNIRVGAKLSKLTQLHKFGKKKVLSYADLQAIASEIGLDTDSPASKSGVLAALVSADLAMRHLHEVGVKHSDSSKLKAKVAYYRGKLLAVLDAAGMNPKSLVANEHFNAQDVITLAKVLNATR